MENASKALIIAGAILLAILLISLGIIIFSQAQDTVNNSGMTQAELQTFNEQFLKYEGERKGTVVKSMMQEVFAVNANGSENTVQVLKGASATDTTGTGSALTSTSGIDSSHDYQVTLGYSTDGRVNKIIIFDKDATP